MSKCPSISITSFMEINHEAYDKSQQQKVKDEIHRKGKEYILSVDEEQYKNYLHEIFTLEKIEINIDSESFDEPVISTKSKENFRYKEYRFEIKYSYKGSEDLFKIQPFTFIPQSIKIKIYFTEKRLSFSFGMRELNKNSFIDTKRNMLKLFQENITKANNYSSTYNIRIKEFIDNYFKKIKNEYLAENDFFESINLNVQKDTDPTFTVPIIKKIKVPEPQVDSKKSFSYVPTISDEMYNDIIATINKSAKIIEQNPALYNGKNEGELRDQLLFALSSRYESTSATAESFNKKGKTDILLKYPKDGTNIFIAECKFWKGQKEFHKDLNQLFGYLTWRDTKSALIYFVNKNGITEIVRKAIEAVERSSFFVSQTQKRHEDSFSYIFCSPGDSEQRLFLELFLFHFPDV